MPAIRNFILYAKYKDRIKKSGRVTEKCKQTYPDHPLLLTIAQSVTCLARDAYLSADPGIASSIIARSHTIVEIDHEIISTVILLLQEWLLSVTSEVLVTCNCLFKLAQEKCG